MKKLFLILKDNKVSSSFALILVSLPIVLSSSISAYVYTHESQIATFGWQHWVIIYLISVVTMGLAITPTTFVAILGGYFLSWYSLTLMIPAYLLASLLCYAVSSKLDGGQFKKSLTKYLDLESYLEKAYQQPLSLVIYSKLSPILPFAISNFLLAVLKISVPTFLLGCLLGMLPRTLLAVWAGNEMQLLLQTSASPYSISLIALLFVISIIGLWRVFRKPTTTVS